MPNVFVLPASLGDRGCACSMQRLSLQPRDLHIIMKHTDLSRTNLFIAVPWESRLMNVSWTLSGVVA